MVGLHQENCVHPKRRSVKRVVVVVSILMDADEKCMKVTGSTSSTGETMFTGPHAEKQKNRKLKPAAVMASVLKKLDDS